MGRVRRWWFPISFAVAVVSAAYSGGRRRRVCLLIALICCSPVLLPLTCLSFPLFCVAAFCLRLGRRRRPPADWDGSAFLNRCEEGEGVELPPEEEEGVTEGELLQRYLEDQLELVVASALDCDEDCAGDDVTFVIS